MPHPASVPAGPSPARTAATIALIAIVAAGAGLRIYRIAANPLWLDEAYSAYAAAGGFRFLWTVVPTYEVHPPFYYSLIRLWTLVFGDSVLALRTLGMAGAIALLPVAILVVRRIAALSGFDPVARRWLAIATTGFLAVSPALVMLAREVRPYTLMTLVYALGLLAILRAGAEARDGRLRITTLAGFFVAQALMLWLHNLGPLFGLAMTLGLAAMLLGTPLRRADWGALIVGHLLVALLYLPALWIMVGQAGEWSHSTWLRWQPGLLGRRLAGLYVTVGWAAASAVALLAILGLVLLARRGGRSARVAALLAILAALPPLLTFAISAAITPVFIPRIISPTIVPVMAAAAVPIALGRRWWRIAALVLALVPLVDMSNLAWRVASSHARQDWTRAVAWLAPRLRPGDVVLSYPNESALPFDRATRDAGLAVDSRPVPEAVPARMVPGGWYSTGSRGVVLLRRPQLRAIARSPALHDVRTIWLLRLGGASYDIGNVFLNELTADDRRMVSYYHQGPIDLVGLQKRAPAPSPRPAGAGLGERAAPVD